MARSRSWSGRLARACLRVLVLCAALSVLSVAVLRWLNPPYSAFMAEAQVAAWIDQDQKFPEHWGFDVEAIEKAYALNQHSHRVHGASTISQQVAKNLFLWSGRSYFRKGLEAYFTVLIETLWPKRRILEIYLNTAQFGHGVYGAEAAAQHFFHKSADRLNRSDAALLAAVLPSPERWSPAAPSRFVQQRRDWILGQMQALGGPEMLDEIDAYPNSKR